MNASLQYLARVEADHFTATAEHGGFSILRAFDEKGNEAKLFIGHPNHVAIADAMADAWRKATQPGAMRAPVLEDFSAGAGE